MPVNNINLLYTKITTYGIHKNYNFISIFLKIKNVCEQLNSQTFLLIYLFYLNSAIFVTLTKIFEIAYHVAKSTIPVWGR